MRKRRENYKKQSTSREEKRKRRTYLFKNIATFSVSSKPKDQLQKTFKEIRFYSGVAKKKSILKINCAQKTRTLVA